MLNSHSAHTNLLHLYLTITALMSVKKIRLAMFINLCKIQIPSGWMLNNIFYIFRNLYIRSVGPETKELFATALCKEKHARSVTIKITINNGNIVNFARKQSHLLMSCTECRFLPLRVNGQQKQNGQKKYVISHFWFSYLTMQAVWLR